MKFLTFALIVLVALAAMSTVSAQEGTCSPWLGYCAKYEDCCRHLTCSTYTAKCVPMTGVIVPGKDTRPIGPGPFPPGHPGNV